MRKIKVHKKQIELYDSIEDMPISVYQRYNRYLLIDAGIGSDVESIDEHITKISKYIHNSDKEMALKELENMRVNIYMVNNQISPKYMVFAALIKSIDGKEVTDHSDENLQAILKDINTIPHCLLVKILDEIKKKIESELMQYFPEMFNTSKEKEAYSKLKQRVMLALDSITKGTDNNAEKIGEIDNYLFYLHKPQAFLGKDSAEILYNKQFEILCVYIAQNTYQDAKKMTVLQFYTTIQTIDKQKKEELKIYKNN